MIDLNRAEQAISSITITNDDDGQQQQQQGYQSKTLNEHNSARHVYLPLFPKSAFGPNDYLLLPNVPITHLSSHEITRRQHGAYTVDALMMMNNYKYSNDGFTLLEQDVEELAARLCVGKSIITFNGERLRGICYTLLALHESFRRNILRKRDIALQKPVLNSKRFAYAFEFYLQMDVDIFYMKTCSFGGADPSRFNTVGLFCENNEPEARYTMIPCNNLYCEYCYPSNYWHRNQSWPVVDFAASAKHEFINGYTTYLNCPATCMTSNVIYSMTCPCGHYDYVDSTAKRLADSMTYHRKHGNRIIHEKLTGSLLFPGVALQPSERENELANKMRLYEHSARCPIALQSFLNCNPDYWCFIPMLSHDAQAENIGYFQGRNSSTVNIVNLDPVSIIAVAHNDNHRVACCLDRVPLPPASYAFSYEQRKQQRSFFEKFLSSPVDELPYSAVDLYQVAIIAVLPDDRSVILRYIVETLFIIHAETKLNMICPIGGDPQQRFGRPYDRIWCTNLNRPFLATAHNKPT